MPLLKQELNINFAQGLDTKTDPWQITFGKFRKLVNMVFQKGKALLKRNGYGKIAEDTPPSSYLTTLNDNLIAIGETVNAYSSSTKKWVTKGNLEPLSLNVMPLVRNNLNQIQTDAVVANNFVCVTYTQTNGVTPSYWYAIEDATTSQNIVPATSIPALVGGTISGTSRVFVVRNFFVIVSPCLVGGTTFLQYVSIPINNPTQISPAQNIYPEAYSPLSSNAAWDGVVTNDTLVVAYNTTAGGQGVHVITLLASQIAANDTSSVIHSFTNAAYIGGLVSLCVDLTVDPNIIYLNFWNPTSTDAYIAAFYVGFGVITVQFAPTISFATVNIFNITAAARNNSCRVFVEVDNSYAFDPTVQTNYINAIDVSAAGVVGVAFVSVRSVGLASKAFVLNENIYYLSLFDSPFQPTLFLINGLESTEDNPVISAKLAYQNAGSNFYLGLSGVSIEPFKAKIAYLYKQTVEALNTESNPQQTTTGGIYSQLGINLVTIEPGTKNISAVDIGKDLNISGGFLGMFDGYYPVEQNFFLFPEPVEATWSATGGSMAAQPNGATNTDAYYYQVTYEWTDMQGNAHKSTPSIPVAVTTTGSGTAGSITVNVPTLRLTAKIANPVKIVIYRLSIATQVYNQVTSIFQPVLNDTTVDSIAYVDTLPDASVTGNNLIYTTGGVLGNINPPATDILTLFDTRLCLVDAEDRDTLRISKTVVSGVPVEMPLEFTIYVARNIGTTSSTGPMTALAPMDDKLIMFKRNSIFYINGTGPDNLGSTSPGCPLGNYSQPTFITSVVGCVNQQSIVLTQDGLMFQSDKGIWILRRNLTTAYIGADVEEFNNSIVTSANVIPDTNYVLFTLDTGEMLMYDYYYGQWGTFEGAPAISSCIYANKHTILNQYGQILQETPGKYLDADKPVLMKVKTGWFNLATLQGYERFYEFYLLARYLSPHKLLAQVAYDYNESVFHQSLITPKNFSPSVPGSFGEPTPFGSPVDVEQWRIHAKKQLCQSFQLSIEEVFDYSLGTDPGAGFTMSGINCELGIKSARRPIRGATTAG